MPSPSPSAESVNISELLHFHHETMEKFTGSGGRASSDLLVEVYYIFFYSVRLYRISRISGMSSHYNKLSFGFASVLSK